MRIEALAYTLYNMYELYNYITVVSYWLRRTVLDVSTRRKLRDGAELAKSLATAEEYFAVKLELNQARQRVIAFHFIS